jgi:MarR family transcriptional regulator, organic hydroperoxide resistance regulator
MYRDARAETVTAKRAGGGGRPSVKSAAADKAVNYPASESIGLLMRIGLYGLRSAFKAALARHKIPWSAWYYLRVLWETDGISQRELTQRVGAMQPNTVSTLRNMKKAGLVTIDRLENDRRSTCVRLTPKARRMMERVLPEVLEKRQLTALEGFTEREEAELKRLLNKMCANVRRHTPRLQNSD